MKKIFLASLFLTAFFGLVSCSSDGDSSQNSTTFKINGVTYTLPPTQGITYLAMSNTFEIDETTYDRVSIIINGFNGVTNVGVVTFDLFMLPGQSIAGDYQISIDENEDVTSDFEQILLSQQRACMGWTSGVSASSMDIQNSIGGNAPTGSVKIISNGGNNYTIQYNGNFKKLLDLTAIPVEVNLTGTINLN
jgi:hypothetical protein